MEKENKKRRRSIRNLRRTSGILPLNLDVLDEKLEESKQESQPDENQQQVFGSVWCESLEPVVKKRRRRSSLLVGLVPKQCNHVAEESIENSDIYNQKAYLTKISEDEVFDNDTESSANTNNFIDKEEPVTDKQEYLASGDANNHNNVFCTEQNGKQYLVNDIKSIKRTNDLIYSADTFSEDVLEKVASPISNEKVDKWNENMKLVKEIENENSVKNLALDKFDTLDDSCNDTQFESNMSRDEKSLERISLSTSDLNDITPPSECNLSNVSPSSMSPDAYQEPFEQANTAVSEDNNVMCNVEMTSDVENDVRSLDCPSKSLQKSPGLDYMSDSSHSDKENSVVNENLTMNLTPHMLGDSTENVSPGFMSMCKAFAGKVVNFVKTSPSFLTGGLLDSSNTVNICASPELKAKPNLNVAPCELSKLAAKSDIDKSLIELEKSQIDSDYKGITDKEIGADCKGDNSAAADIDKKVNTPAEKVLSAKKTVNPCRLGSAKKPRDRKLFYDTFNAVMDALKTDKGQTSSLIKITDSNNAMTEDASFISSPEVSNGESLLPSEEKVNSSSEGNISHDENLEDNMRVKDQNINVTVTQYFDSGNQESPKECESKSNINKCNETVDHNFVASEVQEDETDQNNSEVCIESKEEAALSIVRIENAIEMKDCLDEVRSSFVAIEEDSCERLDQNKSSTGNLSVGNKTNLKGKDKKHKKRALDIHMSDTNDTVKSPENVNDAIFGNANSMVLSKGKQISGNCETYIKKKPENLAENIEQLNSRVKDIDCLLKSDTQENIDSKHIICEGSQIEREKKVSKNLSKARRNRRQSFGIQSSVASTERNSDNVSNSVESDINVAEKPTSEVDEVDGINDYCNVESHDDIENRVAALNLENEEILNATCKDNIGDKCNVRIHEIQDTEVDTHVEKKKRGRRRKSANMNEILKRGRPKKVYIEPVVDEAEEEDSSCQNDGNVASHVNNVSELTDEISLVQIMDSDEKEITVEYLVLPGDDIVSVGEGKTEPRRKRRRSAEAASLRIRMIDSDQSPSSSSPETVITNKGKRGRRKSAGSVKFETHTDLNKQISFVDEDSGLDNKEITVAKRGKKRKFKEQSSEELEKLYKNKNFVRPEEKRPWHTVLESPPNMSDVFGKKRLQRHIDFQVPTQLKLRRRLQKAVKNGWDPKKRMKKELKDDYVKGKLVKLWSELDEERDDPESLQNKLKSIVETV